MSCVQCSPGRLGWSFHGLRSIGISALVTTFLIMLTTNLYFINRTHLDENRQFTSDIVEPTHQRLVLDADDGIMKQKLQEDDDNVLLDKLDFLKEQLKKTRNRINIYKNNFGYKAVGEPFENNLKRHLMNADKVFVTSDQQHSMDEVAKSPFLDEGNKILHSINKSNSSSFITCQEIPQNLDTLERIGSGYTKQVYKVNIGGKYVALKQANREGHDGLECAQNGMSGKDCYRLANYKVLKELALLQQLKSPHIIKLLGYCLRDERGENGGTTSVTIATEYGEPLTFITLLQMSWEDRLKIAFGITKLLVYLHNSPMGALTMHDFKLTQFVLTNNEIQLADLDDVDDTIKTCRQDNDCRIGSVNNQSCVRGRCEHYSDHINVYNAHKLFYSLLPFEAPSSVKQRIANLTKNTGQSTWNSAKILEKLEDILRIYRNSFIYNITDDLRHRKDDLFKKFVDRDCPAIHDYWCHGTIYAGANSCAFSVRNEDEARYLCIHDPQCKAFVMTSQTTWTGRTVVYFKNDSSQSVSSKGNTMFERVT